MNKLVKSGFKPHLSESRPVEQAPFRQEIGVYELSCELHFAHCAYRKQSYN